MADYPGYYMYQINVGSNTGSVVGLSNSNVTIETLNSDTVLVPVTIVTLIINGVKVGASFEETVKVNGQQTPMFLVGGSEFILSLNGKLTHNTNITQIDGVGNYSLCFMAGTMIRTPDGEAAVETLKRGDLVMTTDGVAKTVSWLGQQTMSALFADPVRSWPIRVKAGALGENIPSRDLLLSPDHALLVGDALFHAGALVNGTSIVRETNVPQTWVYYHVELDDHSLILAENAAAETFVDNADRLNFDNWAEHEALYPDGKAIAELPYPRAKARRQVPARIWAMLAERAAIIGSATSDVA